MNKVREEVIVSNIKFVLPKFVDFRDCTPKFLKLFITRKVLSHPVLDYFLPIVYKNGISFFEVSMEILNGRSCNEP